VKRLVSGIMLTLLLTSMLTLAFNIQPAKASGTIYIRADGSIDPPTAPVQRNGNIYILSDNITSYSDGIVIQKDDIVLDGGNHTIRGPNGGGFGIYLLDKVNVTIKSINVEYFSLGIYLSSSSYCSLFNNNLENNQENIYLLQSFHNIFSENKIANASVIETQTNIHLHSSYNNTFYRNTITGSDAGFYFFGDSRCNNISGNYIANNDDGIALQDGSSYNIISGNNVINSGVGMIFYPSVQFNVVSENNIEKSELGVYLVVSSNNFLFHNNFINNILQALVLEPCSSLWDDGYPSGGNYWSDYADVDLNHDGIWDHPYVIDANNEDRYPLVNPWTPTPPEIERIYGIPVDFRFERDLSVKGRGGYYNHPDVRYLQIILNADPDTRIATSGEGSLGNETTYFGDLTENAVKKFQKKYGLPETGYVGELTRGKLNEILNNKFTEEYKNSFNLLNTTERKSAIWNDIKSFKSSYPDLSSFPNELILAVAAVETGEYAQWNNEHVANDWGRGIMQITSNEYVGAGGVDNESEDCIKCRDRVLRIYCSKYYSNTIKGIEANIKDGLYTLQNKSRYVKKDKIQPPEGYTKDEIIWISTVQRYNVKSDVPTDYVSAVGKELLKLANGYYGFFDGFDTELARSLGQNFTKAYSESIRLYSPGELRVYDTTGNVTGIVNAEIREGIPNSICDNETETVIVFFPSQNYYEVAGTETWTYGLCACLTEENETTTFAAINIPTSPNASHQYTIDWIALSQGEEGVIVEVDSGGDGIFEYNFTSDNGLNRTEYVAATTKHDIEITGVTTSKSVTGEGYNLLINATIINYGVYAETFDVTSYVNTTLIALQTIVLASGSFTTITFTWNTTGFAKGNYTLWSYAEPVQGETFTSDNNSTDGWVTVTILGDVNGDGKVRIDDILAVAQRFGTDYGGPPNSNGYSYDANCDVNDDLKIRIDDVLAAAAHFGEGPW
jgi:parallel beta-helix repeat protein